MQPNNKITPISVIKSPLSFYWLSCTNALARILKNVEVEYKCKMAYELGTLAPKLENR